MPVLITGGCGYIGSHTVYELLNKNEDIVILDNISTGHEYSLLGGKLYIGDIRDRNILDKVFAENNIDAVVHFAADSLVGESNINPYKYYHNNVYGTLCLLERMKEHNIKKIVFSSTAAVYGNPKTVPILEIDSTIPTNAYGETKLAIEKMMKCFDEAHGIKYVALRYFNAAGAIETGEIGENHKIETHLIPLALQVPLGKRKTMSIFGDDYDTKDGTCIRDYIHVMDLANAHYLALKYLRKYNKSDIFNLGNGKGYSVKEVINVAKKVTNYDINCVIEDRRKGDPSILIASSVKAKKELEWNTKFSSLEKIILDAWNYYKL